MRISPFMGRRQIRANTPYGTSQAALNASFQQSLGECIGALREFIGELEGVTPDILVEALEPTLGKAMEYCPVAKGDLRASAYLEARRYRGGAEVEIGFGRGGNPSYAIYAHEMPFRHEPPTRAQFLRVAVDEDYYSIINSLPRLIREWAGT